VFYKTYRELFTLKFYTSCFDLCGHRQVLKLLDNETAVFCFVVKEDAVGIFPKFSLK
jgi:hypothetical protein